MSASCKVFRRMLEEDRGPWSPEVESHLQQCPVCRAQERLLTILEEVPHPATAGEDVTRLMERLPVASWQLRRVATWGPLAAGVALLGAGLALIGGLPASSAVTLLPSVSHQVLAWAASGALDILTMLRGSAEALRVVAAAGGVGAVMWLLLTAVGSGLAVRALVRRGARSHR